MQIRQYVGDWKAGLPAGACTKIRPGSEHGICMISGMCRLSALAGAASVGAVRLPPTPFGLTFRTIISKQ